MRVIRQLDESHVDAYADIAFNAYPSFKNFNKEAVDDYKATVIHIMRTDPIVTFYGLFEEEVLIGVMRLFDFKMNAFGVVVPISGLGFLGVHLMHKKKGVARQLVAFYEAHYLGRKIPIASLLPFRPDFYKPMGYGFGTKMNQYRIPSEFLPTYTENPNLRYLTEGDLDQILACHARVVQTSHGRIMKFGDEIRDLFGDAFNRVVGSFDESGVLNGYLVYKFHNGKAGNYTINHLTVKEMIYENTTVLKGLMGYLKKQEDQVALMIFNTEDEHFHYLFDNPLNDTHNYIPYGYLETNTQAIGMMYKLLSVRMAFEQCSHRSYNHMKAQVRFLIEDDYTNDVETVIVHFDGEKAVLDQTTYEVTVKVKGSYFSALFLASTSVSGLYHLGLLELDDATYLPILDLAFYYPQKPVCYTDF